MLARQESIQVNRMLMKRYFLVQKAKDANTIGIVVGTLGVGKTKTEESNCMNYRHKEANSIF